MIKTWKHKGLRLFFQSGVTSGIQAKHQTKLKIILQLLDAAVQPEDMDLPGLRLHRQCRQIGELFFDLRAIMLMMSTMLIIIREVKNV